MAKGKQDPVGDLEKDINKYFDDHEAAIKKLDLSGDLEETERLWDQVEMRSRATVRALDVLFKAARGQEKKDRVRAILGGLGERLKKFILDLSRRENLENLVKGLRKQYNKLFEIPEPVSDRPPRGRQPRNPVPATEPDPVLDDGENTPHPSPRVDPPQPVPATGEVVDDHPSGNGVPKPQPAPAAVDVDDSPNGVPSRLPGGNDGDPTIKDDPRTPPSKNGIPPPSLNGDGKHGDDAVGVEPGVENVLPNGGDAIKVDPGSVHVNGMEDESGKNGAPLVGVGGANENSNHEPEGPTRPDNGQPNGQVRPAQAAPGAQEQVPLDSLLSAFEQAFCDYLEGRAADSNALYAAWNGLCAKLPADRQGEFLARFNTLWGRTWPIRDTYPSRVLPAVQQFLRDVRQAVGVGGTIITITVQDRPSINDQPAVVRDLDPPAASTSSTDPANQMNAPPAQQGQAEDPDADAWRTMDGIISELQTRAQSAEITDDDVRSLLSQRFGADFFDVDEHRILLVQIVIIANAMPGSRVQRAARINMSGTFQHALNRRANARVQPPAPPAAHAPHAAGHSHYHEDHLLGVWDVPRPSDNETFNADPKITGTSKKFWKRFLRGNKKKGGADHGHDADRDKKAA